MLSVAMDMYIIKAELLLTLKAPITTSADDI